jgi:uncharacterized protein YjbI with pentapeptide repeats
MTIDKFSPLRRKRNRPGRAKETAQAKAQGRPEGMPVTAGQLTDISRRIDSVRKDLDALMKVRREQPDGKPSAQKADPVAERNSKEFLKLSLSLRAIEKCDRNDFSGVDLSGMNLSFIDLSGVDFSGANLEGCMFLHCKCDQTNFSHANLKNAKLWMASMIDTDMSHADLTDADPGSSMVHFRVKLEGAKLGEKVVKALEDEEKRIREKELKMKEWMGIR